MKGFLGQLETDASPFPSESALHSIREDTSSIDADFGWLKALRWCPRQLLDLINSKACRGNRSCFYNRRSRSNRHIVGAIMFNDSLSRDQCEQLIRRLSETAFPFQCAHGRSVYISAHGWASSQPSCRPSLVPLVNVKARMGDNDGSRRRPNIRWTEFSGNERRPVQIAKDKHRILFS